MATHWKYLSIAMTAFGLMTMSGQITAHGTVPSRPAVKMAAPPVRRAPFVKRRARLSPDDCSALAVQATLAKARAEMSALLRAKKDGLDDISAAMQSDRRLAEDVKKTFGNSDLITSEYSKRGECVVTLKLSVERLQKLGRDL